MKSLSLLLIVALAACTDRGLCLKKHYESSGYMQPQYMSMCNGSSCTMQFVGMYWADTSGDVCDQWQYPEGKPK